MVFWWLYQPEERVEAFHAKHSFTRKFCGCMSLRGGCAIACGIWMGVNLYACILAFQSRSPFFSHLDHKTLMVQGGVCLLFALIAFYTLFALFSDSLRSLHHAHRAMWFTVCVFIIDFFVTIVIFGMQEQQYYDWCASKSRNIVDEHVSAQTVNGTQLQFSFTPSQGSRDFYNCNKLWQDEMKFAIAIFIVISICYIYWAICLWSYSQKLFRIARGPSNFLPPGPVAPMIPGMMNLRPGTQEEALEEKTAPSRSTEKSLAQITKSLIERWTSKR
ncbi:uncharacterized protein BYT42DRAFT_642911 [Radiomyces spectabilis]|uniref:uncharacterized protein n=1 Tax=Radiomyces spectabilis TaxID=64574 RepID=UPI00222090BB|nr:uncharacterized protein BYT42DRAFT_642911 [Radiomyces spectabilis]KAI8388751.1 hypothetical protein BYT42DRAFT_642911 [Radiomyces spectabilis]